MKLGFFFSSFHQALSFISTCLLCEKYLLCRLFPYGLQSIQSCLYAHNFLFIYPQQGKERMRVIRVIDEGNKLPQQKKVGENDITYLYTERNYLVPEISVQLQQVHNAIWKFQHRLHYVVSVSYERHGYVAKMQIFIENRLKTVM